MREAVVKSVARVLLFTKVLNSIAFLWFAISTFSSLLQEAHIILTAAIPIKNSFFIMIGFKLLIIIFKVKVIFASIILEE
jgi:hypothetical protein